MVTVVGLGFVGLTTALGFAYKGYRVYGIESDTNKLQKILNGEIPFLEPGLKEKLEELPGDRFSASMDWEEAFENSEIFFICVGSPCDEDGFADLSPIYRVMDRLISLIKSRKDRRKKVYIVIKSTVPPSSTKEKLIPYLKDKGVFCGEEYNVEIANNPEFLREGFAWQDFINPDRIVIGADSVGIGETLAELYRVFDAPIHCVSWNTGEFIKYLSNTFLSTMISYSNEMSMIAKSIGEIDISKAFKIMHEDGRWRGEPCNMTSYLYPGCGFGGYCLPKDTLALCTMAQAKGCEVNILQSVLRMNEDIKDKLLDEVEKTVPKDAKIGVLGLAFKPLSDDVRESPAKVFIEKLLARGYSSIGAYDPVANENFASQFGLPISYYKNKESLVEDSAALLILTAWEEFKTLLRGCSGTRIFDFRYFLWEGAEDAGSDTGRRFRD